MAYGIAAYIKEKYASTTGYLIEGRKLEKTIKRYYLADALRHLKRHKNQTEQELQGLI